MSTRQVYALFDGGILALFGLLVGVHLATEHYGWAAFLGVLALGHLALVVRDAS